MNLLCRNCVLSIVLLALVAAVSLVHSYFLSFTARGLPIDDPFNIVFNLAWLAFLGWLAWGIYSNNKKTEKTILYLACFITLMTIFDAFDEGTPRLLTVLGVLTTGLMFATYYCVKYCRNMGKSL